VRHRTGVSRSADRVDPVTEPVAPAGSQDVTDPFPVRFPVVALVASAGGLDALTRVLAPLPADLPAAVLVALHQDPKRASYLVDILRRAVKLPIDIASDGDMLRPGRALVVPPGRHLLVTSSAGIGLIESGDPPPSRPSADLLLATLAVTCGPRALAVVLTGMGHDAQAGVRAIAHCGGTILAQDEHSSRFSAMPAAAVATNVVSRVLAADDLASAIVSHTLAHNQT
jgi:two-component system chemotaxis response regulator CheB